MLPDPFAPLPLAEYFYGDWADIKIIFNDKDNYFITEQDKPTYIMDDSKKNNKIYKVKDAFNADGYRNIYETQETQKS
ncbi:MAG: hypothetical protein U9R27_03645 [Campylobacterota bacterium]|nr:hypothetical protein [Campylobacterota bacterium]